MKLKNEPRKKRSVVDDGDLSKPNPFTNPFVEENQGRPWARYNAFSAAARWFMSNNWAIYGWGHRGAGYWFDVGHQADTPSTTANSSRPLCPGARVS